jgi:type IV secretory pathway VirB6-like protein
VQPIVTLLNTINTQAQTLLLPAVLILTIIIAGYHFMIGDHRGGRTWITGGLFGAALIIGATAIAGLVKGGGGVGG